MKELAEGNAWQTRAGQALVAEVLQSAVQGHLVVLRARRTGATEALRLIAEQDFCFNAITAQGVREISPQQTIAELASPGAMDSGHGRLLDLMTTEALSDAVIIVEVEGSAINSWLTFGGTFATSRRAYSGQVAALILLLDQHCHIPVGSAVFVDDDIVDRLDALLFVRDRSAWDNSLIAQTAAAVLVEVCRGDLDLMQRFLPLTVDQVFHPLNAVEQLQHSGSTRVLPWQGREEPCPFELIKRDPNRLVKRIWKGQLSTLFPWLEEVRTQVIEKWRTRLPGGLADKITGEPLDVTDYEFSQLCWGLRTIESNPQFADAANFLRACRNELAHCRPISSAQFQTAQKAARMLT